MSDTQPHHIELYFKCEGKDYYVGHGVVEHAEDLRVQAGLISTLLHILAWNYEETGRYRTAAPSKDFRPRKVFTKGGDLYFEVSPELFVLGMSHEDAVHSHKVFGGGSTLAQLKRVYPTIEIGDV